MFSLISIPIYIRLLLFFKKYDKISLLFQAEFAYFPVQTRVHICLEDWITSSLIKVY